MTDFTFTVSRTGPTTAQAATINWAVSSTVASANDFVGDVFPSGTLNFAANELSKTLTVQVKGDVTYEPDEAFTVTLSGPSAGTILVSSATGTIRNDDTTPAGVKPNTSARATAMGLTRLWQDRLGDTNEPTNPWDFFSPNVGVRSNWDHFNGNDTYDKRASIVTLDHAPTGITPPIRALRFVRVNGKFGSGNYISSWYSGNYNKFFISWWIHYDSNFADVINTNDGYTTVYGKTPFVIVSGTPNTWSPASGSWANTAVCAVEHQEGCEFGINWIVRTSNPTQIEYSIYAHIPGFGTSWRCDSYSNWKNLVGGLPSNNNELQPVYISLGQWHLVEFYVEIGDTRTSGKMYTWVDGQLGLRLEGMDLGGWVGNRGWYNGQTKEHLSQFPGAQLTDAYSTASLGTLAINPSQRWRNKCAFIREMNGGWGSDLRFLSRATRYCHFWNCTHWAA